MIDLILSMDLDSFLTFFFSVYALVLWVTYGVATIASKRKARREHAKYINQSGFRPVGAYVEDYLNNPMMYI